MRSFSPNKKIPYISICSGYEGIGLGLHRAIPNLRTVAYCEREAFAVSNLVKKVEAGLLDAAPVYTDVVSFPYQEFHPLLREGIVSAGFPCQPVSCAGKRKSTEDERWLFDIICDGFELMQPRFIFFENVDGLLSAKMPDGSLVIAHIYRRLEEMDYMVEVGVFSAAEVGAPHQRKRVFILAVRAGVGYDACGTGFQEHIIEPGAQSGEVGAYPGQDTARVRQAWPSRPGQPQFRWEPPRVVGGVCQADAEGELGRRLPRREGTQQPELGSTDGYVFGDFGETLTPLGLYANGPSGNVGRTLTPNGHDSTVSAGGSAYARLSGKAYAREILRRLWCEVGAEEVQQSVGGYVRLLAETVLLAGMQLDCFTQRICYFVWASQEGNAAQGFGLRGMSGADPSWSTSQGQEPREQLKRELAYAMCQLSYEVALERGQAPLERAGAVPDMWGRWEAEAWHVSEALPEMEEVWRSVFDQAFRRDRIYPQAAHQGRNRVDELRLLGNGVVPATAEKAFRVLMRRFGFVLPTTHKHFVGCACSETESCQPQPNEPNEPGEFSLGGLGLNWQTVRVADSAGVGYQYDQGDHSKPRLMLTGQVKKEDSFWSTIRASDAEHGGPNQRGSKGDLMLPSAVARQESLGSDPCLSLDFSGL